MDPQVRGYRASLQLCVHSQITTSLLGWFLVAYGDKWCPYGHAVQIANPIPCLRLASRSSRAAGAVPPPSDGVNLWTDAATKQKRHWRSRGLEIFSPFCNILFNCVKRLAKKKQNQIDNDGTCRKLG